MNPREGLMSHRGGEIVWTLQYVAPEQLRGKPADARSDIFSFGCVLCEMLTGRRLAMATPTCGSSTSDAKASRRRRRARLTQAVRTQMPLVARRHIPSDQRRQDRAGAVRCRPGSELGRAIAPSGRQTGLRARVARLRVSV